MNTTSKFWFISRTVVSDPCLDGILPNVIIIKVGTIPPACCMSQVPWLIILYRPEFNRYYEEYAAGDEGSELAVESELEYVDVSTPPQHDAGSASASTSSGPDTKAADEALVLSGENTVSQKRDRTDSETACSLGSAEEDFPAAKRMKEEEDEKPDLIVVDSA